MDKVDKYHHDMRLYADYVRKADWQNIVTYATEILKVRDDHGHVWANRGLALQKLNYHLDAVLNYERALKYEETAITYSNLGCAYFELGLHEKALPALHKAIELEEIAQTFLTLGNLKKHEGDLKGAIKDYKKCTELDPDYADGHLVYSMGLLKDGQLEAGWKEYEWRWKTDQMPTRKFKCPVWKGEDLTGKTILVHGEQGLGDIIMFARYVRILKDQFPGAKIIVEGRHEVKRLLATIPEADEVINYNDYHPPVDYSVAMMTLAGMFTPTKAMIPAALDQEFFPEYQHITHWKEKLDELPKGIRVGICWSGMAREFQPGAMAIDQLRSTSLHQFSQAALVPGITWISLQKGPPRSQLAKPNVPPDGMIIAEYTDDMYDFYETCCAVKACDLVISVDTAVVHAAASMGVPTWLLSRWDGCWRWFGDGKDSPWYPSLRQYTQPYPGDWNGMMREVAKDLAEFVKNKQQPRLDLTLE